MYEKLLGGSKRATAGHTQRWVVALGAIAAVAVSTGARADGRHDRHDRQVVESLEVSNLYVFNTETKSKGAVILVRDYNNDVVNVSVSSSDLAPGHVHTIWIVAFNRPWHCSDLCGLDDLPGINPSADPRVHASVFYGGGFIADDTGSVNHTLTPIVPGRTSRELFGGTKDYGLERLFLTEIHVVLRDHGPQFDPADPAVGTVAQQLSTATVCNPNPMACANVRASIHPAR